MGAEEARAIGQAAWAEKMLHGGESNDTTNLGLTPEAMYRARFHQISKPDSFTRSDEDDKAAYRALWGPDFSEKIKKEDMPVAYLADRAMLNVVGDSYLAHIFRGTAVDFDTLHELQKIISTAVRQAYTEGYAARFMETHTSAQE